MERDPKVLADLDGDLDPVTRGDPMNPLQRTCPGVGKPAEAMGPRSHGERAQRESPAAPAGLEPTGEPLEAGGRQHPDRLAQFEYICRTVRVFQGWGPPVIAAESMMD